VGNNAGEGITGLTTRHVALLTLVVLGVAGAAHGGVSVPPWTGGATRLTTLEAEGSRIASFIAGADVSIECVDPARWRSLGGRQGFDPSLTWALTPMGWHVAEARAAPESVTRVSPRACRHIEAFRRAPTEMGSRLCRRGTRSRGQFGECDDWGSKLVAVHVLTHESIHLAGVFDEATADCLAVQIDAHVAEGLGASTAFARSLAREYWSLYYPSQERRYRSPSCRDGRALDLFPDLPGWPTPAAYPPNFTQRIGAFAVGVKVAAHHTGP
jgi:hypothetical protein